MINYIFVMKVTGFKRYESKIVVINVFLSYSLAELLLSVLFQFEVATVETHIIDFVELLWLEAVTYNFPKEVNVAEGSLHMSCQKYGYSLR